MQVSGFTYSSILSSSTQKTNLGKMLKERAQSLPLVPCHLIQFEMDDLRPKTISLTSLTQSSSSKYDPYL